MNLGKPINDFIPRSARDSTYIYASISVWHATMYVVEYEIDYDMWDIIRPILISAAYPEDVQIGISVQEIIRTKLFPSHFAVQQNISNPVYFIVYYSMKGSGDTVYQSVDDSSLAPFTIRYILFPLQPVTREPFH